MGDEGGRRAWLDGRQLAGRAYLEADRLVWRGPERLVIPFGEVTSAAARDGVLELDFGGRRASFELGRQAERWARRITDPPTRARKLGLKSGAAAVLVGLADPAFGVELEAAGVRILPESRLGEADLVFVLLTAAGELERLAGLRRRIRPGAAIWTLRRRGGPGPGEAEVLDAGRRAGLVDVKVVRFSETLSAEKFVIPLAGRIRA